MTVTVVRKKSDSINEDETKTVKMQIFHVMVLLEGTGMGNIIYDHDNNGFPVVGGGEGWAFGQDNRNEVDHFLL